MATKRSSLRVKFDGVADLHEALKQLATREVLVGFPEESSDREKSDLAEPTNATLAYIHDNGAPEQNIPARPFMLPAIESVVARITKQLGEGAGQALRSRSAEAVEKNFHRVGFIASTAIKIKINEGPPPPLAPATLRARARRGRKGAQEELDNRAKGEAPSTDLAKPLVDTGQMRNAANYVIRDRNKRET